MRAAADLIPLIAPDNRGQAGLAYAVVSDHDDPTWLSSRANFARSFTGEMVPRSDAPAGLRRASA